MVKKYFEKNSNLINNILIYNLLKYKDKDVLVIYNEKFDFCKKDILKRSDFFSDLFVSENDFIQNNQKANIYILMNTQMLDKLEIIEKKLIDKDLIYISSSIGQNKRKVLSIEELKLIHSKKWRERKFLSGSEMIEWIKETMEIAEHRIYLECPWFNETAFDQEFIEKIKEAVQRGVDVRIKYGINLDQDDRAEKTIRLISKIKSIGRYENLQFIEANSHAKVAFIDNFYLMCSLNFGSNSMTSENSAEEKGNISICNNKRDIIKIQKSFEIF